MPVSSGEDTVQERLALLDQLRHSEVRATGSRVAAVAGHLMGTPLNVIAGRASLIRRNPSPEQAMVHAQKIEEQVVKLTERVRRLIDRLNPVEPPPRRGLMTQIVTDALGLYGPIAELTGVRIAVEDRETTNKFVQDGAAVLVVLTALLSLAIRITSRGDVVELRSSTTATNGVFEIEVPGLTVPEGQIDLMDSQEDADPSGAPHLQVFGVCSALARRLGGELQIVTSAPGRGAMRLSCSLSNYG